MAVRSRAAATGPSALRAASTAAGLPVRSGQILGWSRGGSQSASSAAPGGDPRQSASRAGGPARHRNGGGAAHHRVRRASSSQNSRSGPAPTGQSRTISARVGSRPFTLPQAKRKVYAA